MFPPNHQLRPRYPKGPDCASQGNLVTMKARAQVQRHMALAVQGKGPALVQS